MLYVLPSFGKINLALRVTGRLADGYHSLRTVFLRVGPLETLSVNLLRSGGDVVRVHNAVVTGENLVERALTFLRRKCGVPPLEIEMRKQIPPGTGLGAGSGNAAALLDWAHLALGVSLAREEVCALGADVPFLASGMRCAFAGGIGDVLDAAPEMPHFAALICVPAWRNSTGPAYAALDALHEHCGWMDETEAYAEAHTACTILASGGRPGLLPNDFLDAMRVEERTCADAFFRAAERTGLSAWGLSGSGSALFALAPDFAFFEALCDGLSAMPWIRMLSFVR